LGHTFHFSEIFQIPEKNNGGGVISTDTSQCPGPIPISLRRKKQQAGVEGTRTADHGRASSRKQYHSSSLGFFGYRSFQCTRIAGADSFAPHVLRTQAMSGMQHWAEVGYAQRIKYLEFGVLRVLRVEDSGDLRNRMRI